MNFRCHYIIIVVLLLVGLPPGKSQTNKELALKGVLIEKFTRFIEWPVASTIANDSVFNIAVINYPAMEKELLYLYANMKIRDKKVVISGMKSLEINSKMNFDAIFFGPDTKEILDEYLHSGADNGDILLLADSPGYARRGVHINFYISDNNVRFEINETAVKKSELLVSYLLYKSARIVNPVGN